MAKADVEREILIPMRRIFTAPRQYDDAAKDAALLDYVAALEGFDPRDLQTAWVHVRDTTTGRAWPMPGAFVAAATKAKRDRDGTEAEAARHNSHHRAREVSHWQTWTQVRHGALAMEAARRGVAWAFKCRILEGFEPKNIDLSGLARAKAMAGATHRRIEADQPLISTAGRDIGIVKEPNKSAALSMWHQLQINEAQTAEEIGFRGQVAEYEDELQGLVG